MESLGLKQGTDRHRTHLTLCRLVCLKNTENCRLLVCAPRGLVNGCQLFGGKYVYRFRVMP
jgi:hypothetical protein